MKRQSFPESKIRVGGVLFRCSTYTDDNNVSHCDIDTYVITSIKRKRGTCSRYGLKRLGVNHNSPQYVNLVQKNQFTFVDGKLQKSIPSYFKEQFKYGDDLPHGIYTTKLQAVKYQVSVSTDNLKWYEDNCDSNDQDYKNAIKELRLVKGTLTKLNKTKDK